MLRSLPAEALEEPVGAWAARLAGAEPTHPADHLRGINLVTRHIDDFEKGSQAAAALMRVKQR